MNLNGQATAKNVLRGKISALTVYVTDAYAIAVQNGFEGTEQEWLESLRGEDGVSPVVEVAVIEGGHRVTITDRNGSHIYDVYDGVDGVSPVVYVEETEDGHLVTITDKNGDHPYNVPNGKDGVNVSITKITESPEDDGYSTIEFSNGSVLKIKNGSKGETGAAGANGTSVSIVSVTESTADGGSNVVTFSDGSTLTVKNGTSGGGGVSSWNDLTDKPFYEETETLKLDFSDLPEVSVNIDEGVVAYKVSDLTPSVDGITPTSMAVTVILANGSEMSQTFNDFEYFGQENVVPDLSMLMVYNYYVEVVVFIAHRAGEFTSSGTTVTVPEKGMYVSVTYNTDVISEAKTAELSMTINKPLDNKYLGILEKSAEVDVFAEQEVTLAYDESLEANVINFNPGFYLTAGEEYKVLWGEETYVCTAVLYEVGNSTILGNTAIATGVDNGLPFTVGSNNETGGVTIGSLDGSTTKRVRIYQGGNDTIKEEYLLDFADSVLSTTSKKPLQNKVITTVVTEMAKAIAEKQDKIAVPSSVDMSGYDSGTIVETFADGTTKTTTIEFDADGNPTKITDEDGNVTTYTW